ncbi:ABC transporter ATP-binding protein [Xanthomonas campestris pv. cannae]|nr:ABC transporter ATP-binding protein [Xanthomonas campestris pv. cannae]
MGASLTVRNLRIVADGPQGEQVIVHDLSFELAAGQVLALIGESGSGKTTTALALMGHARSGCRIAGGSVRLGEDEVLSMSPARRRALRGRRVAYIAQSAAAAFDPARTLLDQVIEPALIHGLMPRAQARARALALFHELALPDPEQLGRRYPHQVSGGQLQRVMAAMALINEPDLLILDEPTTALDVTTQIEVLAAFRRVVRERNATAVYVSHDLAVVAQMADQILVLRHGRCQEQAPTQRLLAAPADGYTRQLLAAATPHAGVAAPPATPGQLLLEVRGLDAGYGRSGDDGRPHKMILHKVGLRLDRGQALGVIGESGSGKSTLARVIAGLVSPCAGDVLFNGRYLAHPLRERRREVLRQVQIVFQMADTALNPAQTVEQILARPLQLFHGLQGAALRRRTAALLDLVKLPATLAGRRPGGLSGGQKQRVNLARALAAEPELILCDEVTSALDPVVAAAVLELIAELRRELGTSYLFISHDLHAVRAVCDAIVVMRHGRVLTRVERADYDRGPHHPYYAQLARSVPELRCGWLDEVHPMASAARPAPPTGTAT